MIPEKHEGPAVVASDAGPISNLNLNAANVTQTPTGSQHAVDVLLARALSKACLDLDYGEEIELARKLASDEKRRAAA